MDTLYFVMCFDRTPRDSVLFDQDVAAIVRALYERDSLFVFREVYVAFTNLLVLHR